MNAHASTLSLPTRRTPWGWLVPMMVALLVAAFLGGLIAGRSLAPSASGSGTSSRPATQPHVTPARVGEAAPRVTGTGPDLLEMAARSRAVLHVAVTGTGPDLTQVANYGGHG